MPPPRWRRLTQRRLIKRVPRAEAWTPPGKPLDRPPRILILTAAIGSGHLRAAEAVELALRAISPDALIRNVDVLTLSSVAFKKLYAQSYLQMVHRTPHLVGMFYEMTDKAVRPEHTSYQVRTFMQRLSLRELLELIRGEGPSAQGPWDIIINTHFLPPELIAQMRRGKKIRTPQATVVTDFESHGLWVHEPTEQYFVATEEARLILESWDVDPSIIEVTGIPIHPAFAERKDMQACRLAHGLSPDQPGRPVLLLLAGGFALGPVAELYQTVLKLETPVHVVCVCGRNTTLKAQVEKIPVPERHRATITGFTTKIDELMAASEIVISKPGGLTTSEVLARGAAMAIVNPIPGQETRNSDYLLENGAAVKINAPAVLPHKLDQLLQDPQRLWALRARALALGMPNSGELVARRVLEMCGCPARPTPQP
jgi:processive 1,2-diacylglycerol beta-glucosyltransferase